MQESQDAVRQVAAAQGFEEHPLFPLIPTLTGMRSFRYARLESVCQSTNAIAVVTRKRTEWAINEQLLTLTGLLHDDLLLTSAVIN